MTTSRFALDPRIRQSLEDTYQSLLNNGEVLSREQLQRVYSIFRSRFGPEALLALDGEELLNTMHSLEPDSLVYWLEYKNDEEFHSSQFGGISGGSALKYGIYRRKDNGAWMTGSSRNQYELSTAQAVEIARRHRDQFAASAQLFERLPANGSDSDYLGLQNQLNELAPDIANTAWGHKYLSLLYPGKVDTFHVEEYERFHLIKLLQAPPRESGRYVASSRYVALAEELGISLIHLAHTLNVRNGRPYRVWRIGSRIEESGSIWPLMRDHNIVAIGWTQLGDLSELKHDQASKDWLRDSLLDRFYSDPRLASRKAGEMLNFTTVMAEGDLALAADGQRILGIGRISGTYQYRPDVHNGAPHQVPVDWLSTEKWEQPFSEGLRTTVFQIRKNSDNLVAIEKHILDLEGTWTQVKDAGFKPDAGHRLSGVPGRIQALLERKGQAIIYGPPGTGKTFWARNAALDLAALGTFGQLYQELEPDQRLAVSGDNSQAGLVRVCTFHPAYGYEDFLEGYRPRESGTGQLVFERRDGIFRNLCADADRNSDRKFYLLIDEINRGDIPRIFGELLTLLELDKRGQAVFLPLSGEPFQVPKNVYIIGTMNTADRSIALLDTALRRRFGFIELMPDANVLKDVVLEGSIPLGPWLAALNERIRTSIGRDARNLQIGHAYLLDSGKPVADFARFSRILADDIIPLLEEYCYEDYATLTKILGQGLVDEARQRVRDEMFAPGHHDELIQAIMAPFPEIAASREAIVLDQSEELEEDDLDDQDET